MRIDLTKEQKENILKNGKWEELINGSYKELEVCEILIPNEKSYLTIEMTCDVDITYNAHFDYRNNKLMLGLSSQRFETVEGVNIYAQVMGCLNSDFNKLKLMLKDM